MKRMTGFKRFLPIRGMHLMTGSVIALMLILTSTNSMAIGAGETEILLNEVTPSGVSYTIESDREYENAEMIAAFYNRSGKLIDCKVKTMNIRRGVENGSLIFPTSQAGYYKLFLLEGNTSRLLCPAGELIHRVVFQDYNGTIISEQRITDRHSAVEPDAPQRTGYTFSGWDRNYTDIQEDTVCRACYTPDTVENIFSVSDASGTAGDLVTVSVRLGGSVLITGFDIQLSYDTKMLDLVSVDSERSMDVLDKPLPEEGEIFFNYLSARGDRTSGGEISEITFRIKSETEGRIPLRLCANSVVFSSSEYGSQPVPVAYSMKSGEIRTQ